MFGAWIHPQTGEKRIYVNDVPVSHGGKIWITHDLAATEHYAVHMSRHGDGIHGARQSDVEYWVDSMVRGELGESYQTTDDIFVALWEKVHRG